MKAPYHFLDKGGQIQQRLTLDHQKCYLFKLLNFCHMNAIYKAVNFKFKALLPKLCIFYLKKKPTPAPIFNYRKRPRQAVFADPLNDVTPPGPAGAAAVPQLPVPKFSGKFVIMKNSERLFIPSLYVLYLKWMRNLKRILIIRYQQINITFLFSKSPSPYPHTPAAFNKKMDQNYNQNGFMVLTPLQRFLCRGIMLYAPNF